MSNKSFFMAKLYTNGYGLPFEDGSSRYVIWKDGVLVGEFVNQTQALIAFKLGVFVENGVRKSKYLGLSEFSRY